MENLSVVYLVGSLLLVAVVAGLSYPRNKANIPTLGSSLLFGYVAAKEAFSRLPEYLLDGARQFNGKPFQIPAYRGWVVYVSGQQYINDIRRAGDEVLNMHEHLNDDVCLEYTFSPSIARNASWHIPVVRKQLTSNLAKIMPDVYEETSAAFEDALALPETGAWKAIPAMDLALYVICRATNRMFVGLPLCRDEEFTRISRDFTATVTQAGGMISLFPTFLRPLVGRYWTKAPGAIRTFEKYLFPIIEERQRKAKMLGEKWLDRPNDFLQWLLDAAEGEQGQPKEIVQRMLFMNFAGTFTSAQSFTHALYDLATYTQHIPTLREEVDAAVKEHGWTRDALNAMIKVDSFLKESMRLNGPMSTSLGRKVLKPFLFSDGTTLRAGSHLNANSHAVHHDADLYDDPFKFDPFRFSRLIEQGENPAKHAWTAATPEYLYWGYGAHTCAGRFFASQELKGMLAHIVLNYDVRMQEEGVRPPNIDVSQWCIPNPAATVMFRRRLM